MIEISFHRKVFLFLTCLSPTQVLQRGKNNGPHLQSMELCEQKGHNRVSQYTLFVLLEDAHKEGIHKLQKTTECGCVVRKPYKELDC